MSGSSRGMVREILSLQRNETRLVFEIDENGGSPQLLTNARHASISRAGAGDYTLTLNVGASRNLVALASGLAADTAIAFGTRDNSSIQILITDLAGVAKDADCCVEVIAWDSPDDT